MDWQFQNNIDTWYIIWKTGLKSNIASNAPLDWSQISISNIRDCINGWHLASNKDSNPNGVQNWGCMMNDPILTVRPLTDWSQVSGQYKWIELVTWLVHAINHSAGRFAPLKYGTDRCAPHGQIFFFQLGNKWLKKKRDVIWLGRQKLLTETGQFVLRKHWRGDFRMPLISVRVCIEWPRLKNENLGQKLKSLGLNLGGFLVFSWVESGTKLFVSSLLWWWRFWFCLPWMSLIYFSPYAMSDGIAAQSVRFSARHL